MADQLGSAVLTLSVDDRQYNAGLQRAKQSVDQTLGSIGKQGASAAGLAGNLTALGGTAATVAAGMLAVGAAVAGIGYFATKTGGEIQRLNAAFVGLTGSAEAAKQLRQDLFTLSKTTPFRNEEILQAAQRFLAVGVSVKNLQGTINRVGAIAAQSGQSLERLALIYAQVYAKGRLQGEENMQLLEAGVDLTQELSKVTGLSGTALQDAMSKGQIGVDKFNAALKLATGDMSALQQAGQAVDVQFANIGDNIGQLFGGLATSIAPALSAAFGVINQIFDQAFPSLTSIEELFAPLTNEAKRFSDVLAGNPQLISAIAAGVREWATLIVNDVAKGLQFVNNILSKIDGDKLTKSFIESELVLRRIFLAAQGVGQLLVKNAELSLRALSNPLQFGKDIAGAGGFTKFIEKEYRDVRSTWDRLITSKPLTLGGLKAAGPSGLAGNLDNKLSTNTLNAATTFKDAANKILEASSKLAQARLELAQLQASPTGLNQYLSPDVQQARTQQSLQSLRPAFEQAVATASRLLQNQGISPVRNAGTIQGINGQSITITQPNLRIEGLRDIFTNAALGGSVTSSSVQAITDFINTVQAEAQAVNSVATAQQEINQQLVQVNGSLRDQVAALVAKDWTVQVNVGTDGGVSSYGQVLNQAVTP